MNINQDPSISNEIKFGVLVILTEWLINRRETIKKPNEIK
jgi:hypothetical protein